MRTRLTAHFSALAVLLVILCVASPRIAGQGTRKSTPPRTAWGDPDLQGQWNSQTSTPLQRPLEGKLASRETLSEEEADANEEAERRSFDQAPRKGDPGTYN